MSCLEKYSALFASESDLVTHRTQSVNLPTGCIHQQPARGRISLFLLTAIKQLADKLLNRLIYAQVYVDNVYKSLRLTCGSCWG